MLEIVRVVNMVEFDIDFDVMYVVIDDFIGMVYICNLNNLMGKVFDLNKFCEFCIKVFKKILVLVDEVYNEFIDEFFKYLMILFVKVGYNVIVVRIFLKIYGLVGMCVGYLIVLEENIEWINCYGMGGYILN